MKYTEAQDVHLRTCRGEDCDVCEAAADALAAYVLAERGAPTEGPPVTRGAVVRCGSVLAARLGGLCDEVESGRL